MLFDLIEIEIMLIWEAPPTDVKNSQNKDSVSFYIYISEYLIALKI
jgi:hypothetical protein